MTVFFTVFATSFPTSYQLLCLHLYSPICYLISYFIPTFRCVCICITLFVLFVCTICTYYCTVECKDPPIAIPMSQFKGVLSKCLLNLTPFDGNTVFYCTTLTIGLLKLQYHHEWAKNSSVVTCTKRITKILKFSNTTLLSILREYAWTFSSLNILVRSRDFCWGYFFAEQSFMSSLYQSLVKLLASASCFPFLTDIRKALMCKNF